MTKPLTALTTITIITSALWLTIGGTALAIATGAIVFVSAIFGAFALGSWWSAKLMREGAEIALQAQISDDKRDSVLIREIGQLARKFSERPQLSSGDYPLLPFGESETVEADFTIAGLDEDR